VAQVVPALATFAVDDGFSYRVPDSLTGLSVGSIVRIPLGGRRVRGFVTHVREEQTDRTLKDITGIVGELPVFTPRLLATLRWAAIHYLAPVATMLGRTGPPNSPRRLPASPMEPGIAVADASTTLGAAVVDGSRVRAQYIIGGRPWTDQVASLATSVLERMRNMAVVMPTIAEAIALADSLEASAGLIPHLVTSQQSAASRTRAWSAAETAPGQLLVGTRELAPWKLGALDLVLVVEEGRPAMKAPQTPTLGVQTLLRRRSNAEGFQLAFAGVVPTTEALAAGVEVTSPGARPWGLIEVVDRSEEPPGGGLLLESTIHAMRGVLSRNGRVFVFVTRRGDAAAYRCASCGELRRCAACDAAASREARCQRCDTALGPCAECGGARFQALGAAVGTVTSELRRKLGDRVVRPAGGGSVEIGTEKDIVRVFDMDLAVIVDADGPLLAPHYRAEEDALRTFARVASTVTRGRGRRCLIQTLQPSHLVFSALRTGDPLPALHAMLSERETAGFPPVAQLVAIELVDAPGRADADITGAAEGLEVLGPARVGGRDRWLVSGADLRPFKVRLRSIVQSWRDAGSRVRIDADPIRL